MVQIWQFSCKVALKSFIDSGGTKEDGCWASDSHKVVQAAGEFNEWGGGWWVDDTWDIEETERLRGYVSIGMDGEDSMLKVENEWNWIRDGGEEIIVNEMKDVSWGEARKDMKALQVIFVIHTVLRKANLDKLMIQSSQDAMTAKTVFTPGIRRW